MLYYVIQADFETTTALFYGALERLKPDIVMTSRHEGFYTVRHRFLFLKLNEQIRVRIVQRGMFASAVSVDEEKLSIADRTACRKVFSRIEADINTNLKRT